MSTINSYATLQNFLDYKSTTDTDTVDDAVVELLLMAASRYIDTECGRTFYPRLETRLYDVPAENLLFLFDDLVEVSVLLNGDSTTISSSDYTLMASGFEPKWGLKLKDSASISWSSDENSSREQVISLTGWFCYHNQYTRRGWTTGGTLASAMTDTTTASFTASNGHTLTAGMIVKIDDEIMNLASISSSDTVAVNQRGDNGTTAATHLKDAVVYIWNTQPDIKQAALEIAVGMNNRRKGQNMTGAARVTAAGIVITPQDVPTMARDTINRYTMVT